MYYTAYTMVIPFTNRAMREGLETKGFFWFRSERFGQGFPMATAR